MLHEREWSLRTLKTFETISHHILGLMPTPKDYERMKKTKEDSGENDFLVELMYQTCEKIKDEKAPINCLITPLEDTKRDEKLNSP